ALVDPPRGAAEAAARRSPHAAGHAGLLHAARHARRRDRLRRRQGPRPARRGARAAAAVGLVTSGTLEPREVERMFDRIAGPYDLMNRVMTAGLDQRWRSIAARETGVGRGATVVDACC